MTQAEITAFLPVWPPPWYYDTGYAVPTSRWLFRDFLPAISLARHRAGKSTYTRRNDCDNFARAFAVAAQDAWADSPGVRSDDEALAFGEFCYHRADGRGAHAINVAITDEGLVFIEPQTAERITLTPAEIATAFRVSF
jgi:hypothetical protein